MAASSWRDAFASRNILCICETWPGVATDLARGDANVRFLPMFERDLDGVCVNTGWGTSRCSALEDSCSLVCRSWAKAREERLCGGLIGASRMWHQQDAG